MTDNLTKACINLFAILRNLEDLCEIDAEAKELIAGKNISIQFIVKDGPNAIVAFKDGKVRIMEGVGKCDLKLYFSSPQKLNDMFDGKGNPIPLKGFSKIKFMTNEFTKLTDRLAYYLKPTDELLKNKEYFRINTLLTMYTAIFALAQIGNYDRLGKIDAARIPNGIVSVTVKTGEAKVFLTVKNGRLTASKTVKQPARAFLVFSSLEVANAILSGKLATYIALGEGEFEVKGYINMLDNVNKILALVPKYVS